ncbi:MAG: class IV adenylate cyclase [Desulfobacterales bacterium]
MTGIEIEVKFYVDQEAHLRHRIMDLGAAAEGRCFETNHRYDDAAGSLLEKRVLLRLRRDRRSRMTVKLPTASSDDQFKVHRELEVAVSDFATADRILDALGFRRIQRYEKWRESFRIDDAVLCLDSLPYGTFLEIEGTREAIRDIAGRLELAWSRRILANYLEIFETLKAPLGITSGDLTFDAFKSVTMDPRPWIHGFEADRIRAVGDIAP